MNTIIINKNARKANVITQLSQQYILLIDNTIHYKKDVNIDKIGTAGLFN